MLVSLWIQLVWRLCKDSDKELNIVEIATVIKVSLKSSLIGIFIHHFLIFSAFYLIKRNGKLVYA